MDDSYYTAVSIEVCSARPLRYAGQSVKLAPLAR